MADLNNQQHLTVAGGTEVANLNDDPGSPLNVVPHNLSLHFAFNEDEDALVEGRVSPDPKPISSAITPSILNQNGLDDDEDGVQDCTFTQLLSTGVHADEEFYVHHTPNGTRMWCPNVPIVLKPVVGSVYETWKDVFSMYKDYAVYSGFSIRKGQTKRWKGVVTHQYIRCTKYSKPQIKRKTDTLEHSSLTIRQSNFTVTDCKASILVKFCEGSSTCTVVGFNEHHNHPFVERFNRDLSRTSRKLPFASKQFIHNMSLNRIGPIVSHRVLVSLMGGHHNVRGTPTDFKNWSQSVRLYIGDRDAQLVIDRLKERSESLPDFYYEFVVEKGQLRSIFWADEISKINYEVFGDVLAFDATYHTNKYNMIFVPFTGVDNHKQCVTFGAGLLFNETTESYKWLLESFLKAHKKQPKLVLTDQDPSMKAAISEVFTDSRHRLCMWHIMKKLPTKIAGDLFQNSELRALMHRLVWSIHMKPSTFETRWQLLMEEYGLQDHDWLKDMYSIRDQWVPAYFRDIPMCCLMKTTSRCESSNSSFKVNSSSANTLVQFMLCYETRIDNQRYRQRVAEFKTSSSVFMDSTDLAIEKHAFELYTHAISTEVRKEIYKGKLFCYIVNTEDCEEGCVYYVNHLDKRNNATNTFTVILELSNQSVSCSCNNFIRIGYLCRHIFCVYRVNNIERIPAQYVVKRWTRDVLPKSLFSIESRYGVDTRPQAAARSQILEIVTECVDALRSDVGGLSSFAEQIKELKCKLLNGGPVDDEANNDNYAAVEELLGVSLDGDVTLDNPDGIRNKGRGKRRRLSRAPQDGTSNSAVKPPKTPRLCRTCMKYVTGHDSRNCKKKKNKNKSGNEDEDEDSSSASQEST
ncbi:protein FAR1-RELATED SEQUENCE 5-like [Helianthus annuus]|uniref:protein FAR1-RELATED SEQUENCE 5-like n=1 Tax=Helianthus annuus TaxID=4232 RepID=UPI0016532FBE|nr:protein FAR1-RELATED SEQUENCE 5-like [Helianthus annuus]